MIDIVPDFSGLWNELELCRFRSVQIFRSLILYVERLQHFVPARAEAEDQKTLECLAVLAGIVDGHLIDLGLVEPDLAVREQHGFWLGLGNVSKHLGLITRAPKIYFSLLSVGFLDHFLKMIPDEAGFGAAELGTGAIHLSEHTLEIRLLRECVCYGQHDRER